MSKATEAVVRKFIRLAHGQQQSVDEIAALFAKDAVIQIHVPSAAPVVGHHAIHEEIHRQNAVATGIADDSEVRTLVSNGRVVVAERIDRFKMAGLPVELNITGVFEFNARNKITAWREYWDTAHLARQLGIDIGLLWSRPRTQT